MKLQKKLLAIVLSVAMLMSCMVFSFSASADVTLMWENHFDNGTDSNWKIKYNETTYASNSDVGNVAVLKTDETDPTNSYMSLTWTQDAAETRQTGFTFFHEQATHNDASVRYGYDGVYAYTTSHQQGMFRPEDKKYAIKFDYKLANIREGATHGVRIKVGAGGWFNPSYPGGLTEYNMNNNGKQIATEVATVYAADVAKGWQTAVAYIDYVHTANNPADESASMYLYAGMTGYENDVLDEAELLIDNVMIYEYADVSDLATVTIHYDGEAVNTASGLPGAPYTLPDLSSVLPAGVGVSYWADEDYTVPMDIPTAFSNANIDIYVKTSSVKLMWENHFDNGNADVNWLNLYGGKEDLGMYNSGRVGTTEHNYAVHEVADDNGYMALGFLNYAARQRMSAFRLFHQDTTKQGDAYAGQYGYAGGYPYTSTAKGMFLPKTGKYAIKLDYKVSAVGPSYPNASLDICLAVGSVNWSNNVGMSGIYLENTDIVPQTIATVDKDDTTWATAMYFFDVESDSGVELNLLAKRAAGYSDSLTGWEIQIDNVEIYAYEDLADFSTITLHYDGEVVDTAIGVAGTPYIMPDLSDVLPENASVSYWADADFTVPMADPTVFGGGNMNVYLKVDKIVKMWQNHFDNGDAETNWLNLYGGKEALSMYNSGRVNNTVDTSNPAYNYAVHETADNNGYMALGFENYNASNRISGFRIFHQDETKKGDQYAGQYGYAGAYSYSSTAKGLFLPKTGKYAIKFDYRVSKINEQYYADAKLEIGLAVGGVNWSNNIGLSSGNLPNGSAPQTIVTLDKSDTAWATALHFFDVESDAGVELNLLAKAANGYTSGQTGWEVQIDNLEIYAYEDIADFPTVSVYYDGELEDTSIGFPGLPYTMPAIAGVPVNSVLSYWADADLTVPMEAPTAYNAGNINVYVKADTYLASDPWSFESETIGSTVSAKGNAEGGTLLVSNKYARSGSQSLEIQALKGYTRTGARNFALLKNGNGDVLTAEQGKSYLLTYWVLVPSTSATLTNNLMLAGIGDRTSTSGYFTSGNDIVNKGIVFFRDTNANAVQVPNDGQWHKIVRYIDGAAINKATMEGNIIMGLTNVTDDENLYFYVDDVDLIALDDLGAQTGREQYLFDATVGETKTHLHKYVGNSAQEGNYTSIRLGATYTAGDADGDTIVLGDEALPLSERGIIVDIDDNAATLSVDSYKWATAKKNKFDTAWAKNGNDLTFTLRLANINEAMATDTETKYVYRSYFKVTVPYYAADANTLTTAPITIYGETSDAFSFNDIYTDCTSAPDYVPGVWFN